MPVDIQKNMTGTEIRQKFLDFFVGKGHFRMPSSSLVPRNDPTVLLTTAGMQQMIPYFLGRETPPALRLTSAQKCFRTTDIDKVGNERTLTFFEMLGNFSVGDYFKRGAITYAWEFLTQVVGLPAERLHPTVHPEDDEAAQLWTEITGIPDEAITRLEDNWWGPPGASGPCGPDSEIYYDRGVEHGCGRADCKPGCDCERFLEIWNLVFMQFYQDLDGTRTPLPKKNIDTGLGLERLSMVLQGKETVFDTDLFRRILRRAVRHGKLLGLDKPFLSEAADTVINLMKGHYVELATQRDRIVEILSLEEKKFGQTLNTGLYLLNNLLEELRQKDSHVIPGEEAFKLYDSHGFPLEFTQEVAAEHDFTVDIPGFEKAMQQQQERSRSAAAFTQGKDVEALTAVLKRVGPTEFTGYDGISGSSKVVGLVADGVEVESISAPQSALVILDATPFYAESGGQIGDRGDLS